MGQAAIEEPASSCHKPHIWRGTPLLLAAPPSPEGKWARRGRGQEGRARPSRGGPSIGWPYPAKPDPGPLGSEGQRQKQPCPQGPSTETWHQDKLQAQSLQRQEGRTLPGQAAGLQACSHSRDGKEGGSGKEESEALGTATRRLGGLEISWERSEPHFPHLCNGNGSLFCGALTGTQ